MDERIEIISKIKNKKLKYEDIAMELKNDEEIALIAIETYDGRICKYIGDELKNNKDFAKKVFKKKYGYALSYFSDNVKNDFKCCKYSIVDGFSGYRYIGEKLKNNKELALLEINRKYGHNIKDISKKLREKQDIINAHWNKVYSNPMYFTGFCSIISIDNFGNNIIDIFKKGELKRHTQSRIDEYEEKTEPIQFVKCNKGKLGQEIFKNILNPLVIIIGEKRNQLADKIIKKYYDKNDKYINIIEIYKNDLNTKNIKFISKKKEEIIYLLRAITYTTASDTWLTEDNLNDIREILLKSKMENKNLEIILLKDISDINNNKGFFNRNIVIQLVSNEKHTLHEYNLLIEHLQKNFYVVQYHIHDSCNFDDFEIYCLKV